MDNSSDQIENNKKVVIDSLQKYKQKIQNDFGDSQPDKKEKQIIGHKY